MSGNLRFVALEGFSDMPSIEAPAGDHARSRARTWQHASSGAPWAQGRRRHETPKEARQLMEVTLAADTSAERNQPISLLLPA